MVPQLQVSRSRDLKISMREARLRISLSGALKRITFACAICDTKFGGKWGVSVVIGGVAISMAVTSAPSPPAMCVIHAMHSRDSGKGAKRVLYMYQSTALILPAVQI